MKIHYIQRAFRFYFIAIISMPLLPGCSNTLPREIKPRIIVSTDIGGTDPDDFQSMIHLLMYADLFQIEGLISSPFGPGRMKDILEMIDLYDLDLVKLKKYAPEMPDPEYLRSVCKQGAISEAPFKGYDNPTEGSNWIIDCARKKSDQELWVLVWGGLEDLAQALHDAPDIKEWIRVYWIGGPNKKWSVNSYAYIARHHPDLWMIEANASYRGWFLDADSPEEFSNDGFFENYIMDRGALGRAFQHYLKGQIKMGDTPSLAYLMNGSSDDPTGESWGGSFTKIGHSSRYVFRGNSSITDTIATYGVVEWLFPGPELDIPEDSACFSLEVSGQVWPGYYAGNRVYCVRYSPKKPEVFSYSISSSIADLDGLRGQFVSVNPWPGKKSADDFILGNSWYSDRPEDEFFIGFQQGAGTVSKYRVDFLSDWARRWRWLLI